MTKESTWQKLAREGRVTTIPVAPARIEIQMHATLRPETSGRTILGPGPTPGPDIHLGPPPGGPVKLTPDQAFSQARNVAAVSGFRNIIFRTTPSGEFKRR